MPRSVRNPRGLSSWTARGGQPCPLGEAVRARIIAAIGERYAPSLTIRADPGSESRASPLHRHPRSIRHRPHVGAQVVEHVHRVFVFVAELTKRIKRILHDRSLVLVDLASIP